MPSRTENPCVLQNLFAVPEFRIWYKSMYCARTSEWGLPGVQTVSIRKNQGWTWTSDVGEETSEPVVCTRKSLSTRVRTMSREGSCRPMSTASSRISTTGTLQHPSADPDHVPRPELIATPSLGAARGNSEAPAPGQDHHQRQLAGRSLA
eukprot:629617-Rhodomonas_salina.2